MLKNQAVLHYNFEVLKTTFGVVFNAKYNSQTLKAEL